MRDEGATVLRLHLWFKHAEQGRYRLLNPVEGKFPAEELRNIIRVAATAKRIGYRRFIAVFGAQGEANPSCKRGSEWGDCYDSRYDALTWSVKEQTILALNPLCTPDFDIVYDIAPKSCPPGTATLLNRAFVHFDTFMLTRYRSEFHDSHFIISCNGGPAGGVPAVQEITALYRELNVRPASIDAHISVDERRYPQDLVRARLVLTAASAAASSLDVPLDINETRDDDVYLLRLIEQLAASGQVTNIRQILLFPLREGSNCHGINVAPPYDIAGIYRELGRLAPSGRRLPSCTAG